MKALRCLCLALALALVGLGAAAQSAPLPWEAMARPPEDAPWIPLGDEEDAYVTFLGDGPVTVRSQPKAGGKAVYAWRRFALRAVGSEGDWLRVALPDGQGYVPSALTQPAPREDRPAVRIHTETAGLGYVYVAARGQTPLVADIGADGKHHQLLLPNDAMWQPLLLTLGAGEYTLSIYEAGLYDRPIRLMHETAFELASPLEDTHLALLSGLHTNMEGHPVTVALAKSLCRGAAGDFEKVTRLWDWLMAHGAYDKALAKSIQFSEIPDGDGFIRGEKGICSDFAAFLAVGLRAVGVPAKHVYGKNLRTGNQHAWNEVFLDGRWQIIDATMALSRGPKKFHAENPKNYGVEQGLWDGFH